ncbi:peptide deformylase [Rickettsiales endosymbiont of Trichoplax sp. H2]|uniref:peptide deformylase n=1 Tax=Rickettsiales endosymbiont of Trichoplax sp. H2 TaxID=2021221 RepID=UPI0012B338F8|nr:peptide deformylase [Rickettsiales endosymbiont of Trichoplax sp. H2]MSO14214.1 Peptide deformylase [Rickettsiales endosymbiont of Trichoplax sp. H2]
MLHNINLKKFTKYVFILILLTFNAYGGAMENKNISLDKDKIIEVSIGNKVYKPTLNQEKGILKVLKMPEDEKILRMKSIEIGESELPLVADFMKKYLLSTMYESGGIGIAAVQVGAPIRAFIVDIAKTKIINKDDSDQLDVRLFLRGKLEKGKSVIMNETYVEYADNKFIQKNKITRKVPKIKEENGKKQLIGIEEEVIKDNNTSPDLIIERKPYFFLNPKIKLHHNNEIVLPEGCLSVPMESIFKEYNGNSNVKRPEGIEIEYINENLEKEIMKIDGSKDDYWKWFSRCAQHENDHLDGVLFVDRLEKVSNDING